MASCRSTSVRQKLVERTGRGGSVRVVVTAAVALTVAGCGINGHVSGTDSPSAHTHCKHASGFQLSLASDTGGQPTPVAAATWFAAHGGVVSLPTKGWRVVDRNKDGVTLRAGSSTVLAIQGSDGTWQVGSGTLCA